MFKNKILFQLIAARMCKYKNYDSWFNRNIDNILRSRVAFRRAYAMQVIQTFFRNIQMFIIRVYMIRLGKAAVSNQTDVVYLTKI